MNRRTEQPAFWGPMFVLAEGDCHVSQFLVARLSELVKSYTETGATKGVLQRNGHESMCAAQRGAVLRHLRIRLGTGTRPAGPFR
jgi:hypothetical protein